jgi:hypothetical protein
MRRKYTPDPTQTAFDSYEAEQVDIPAGRYDRDAFSLKVFDAVHAVLARHRPITLDGHTWCPTCRPDGAYPCATVRDIAAALEAK